MVNVDVGVGVVGVACACALVAVTEIEEEAQVLMVGGVDGRVLLTLVVQAVVVTVIAIGIALLIVSAFDSQPVAVAVTVSAVLVDSMPLSHVHYWEYQNHPVIPPPLLH